jgi:hypothetical protein
MQISAEISQGTKQLLERYSRAHGIKEQFLIESVPPPSHSGTGGASNQYYHSTMESGDDVSPEQKRTSHASKAQIVPWFMADRPYG